MKIQTEKQLRALYPQPVGRAQIKVLSALEKHSKNFIETSPFLVISSADASGKMDTSPRGGQPGFVQILDDNRILIPDFGGAMGAQVLGFLPYGSVYGRAAGALTGHAYRGLTKPDTVRQATTNLSPTLR